MKWFNSHDWAIELNWPWNMKNTFWKATKGKKQDQVSLQGSAFVDQDHPAGGPKAWGVWEADAHPQRGVRGTLPLEGWQPQKVTPWASPKHTFPAPGSVKRVLGAEQGGWKSQGDWSPELVPNRKHV